MNTTRNLSLHEKRLNTILYTPVYGLRMPIYGNNLSQYGKMQDRIQAFFAQILSKNALLCRYLTTQPAKSLKSNTGGGRFC